MPVPFNKLALDGTELEYIAEALATGTSGNGRFTRSCQELLGRHLSAPRVMLTTSCTTALEMSAILANIGPGDEVIMPSYTFTSTANAVVLRGAVPVFVDIRWDTLNIDETLIEQAVTERTRAICVVHYAGVGCEMDRIVLLAQRFGLALIEDAAQGFGAFYRGRALGTFGQLGALSFHETKNIVSGEGGALIINDPALIERAEVIWEKGTNRVAFARGLVDKYFWVDVGSSFLPNEITAAFLFAQLTAADDITLRRKRVWLRYQRAFAELEAEGVLRCPTVPAHCDANGHIYYILAPDRDTRVRWLQELNAYGVNAIIHYVPLHSAPAGRKFGRAAGPMAITNDTSDRLIRLPMFADLSESMQDEVIGAVRAIALGSRSSRPARVDESVAAAHANASAHPSRPSRRQ
jgi:dTDP-4-amino-4,6-dideoxygalactose transaminase